MIGWKKISLSRRKAINHVSAEQATCLVVVEITVAASETSITRPVTGVVELEIEYVDHVMEWVTVL